MQEVSDKAMHRHSIQNLADMFASTWLVAAVQLDGPEFQGFLL
jgi:hypothetical protein